MTAQITSFSPRKLISRLETLLKTNLVGDLLAQPPLPNGSFRSYRSRSISVIDVHGAAIDIRKSSTSRSTDVHLLRLAQAHHRRLVRQRLGPAAAHVEQGHARDPHRWRQGLVPASAQRALDAVMQTRGWCSVL